MRGYTKRELDGIQKEWGLRFPPDLAKYYLEHRTVTPSGIDWLETPSRDIREMIAWPVEGFLAAVRAGDWWPEWGERPHKDKAADSRVEDILASAPRLIPINGHRCIPETPRESGNPVFSVFRSDIVHYGADLSDYIARETGRRTGPITRVKKIPFWSRAVEINEAPRRDR